MLTIYWLDRLPGDIIYLSLFFIEFFTYLMEILPFIRWIFWNFYIEMVPWIFYLYFKVLSLSQSQIRKCARIRSKLINMRGNVISVRQWWSFCNFFVYGIAFSGSLNCWAGIFIYLILSIFIHLHWMWWQWSPVIYLRIQDRNWTWPKDECVKEFL